MMTRILPLALCALAILTGTASVADDTSEETTTTLQRQKLADAPGKTGMLVLVSYAPGQASKAHRHPGSVFAYVIEGEVVSQLEGQPPVTYRAGQSWYESPRVPHLVSRNASDTAPAKLLAWLIVDDGAPPKEPWPK
jgi:quercetin dioxygenase-like cupin family protein